MVGIHEPREHDLPREVQDQIRVLRELVRRADLLDHPVAGEQAGIRQLATSVVHRHQDRSVLGQECRHGQPSLCVGCTRTESIRTRRGGANPRRPIRAPARLGARDGHKTAIMREWTDDMRPRRSREPRARGDADRRQHTTVALGASLLGAIVTFLYFRYVDVGPSAPRPGPGNSSSPAWRLRLLGAIGLFLSNRWLRPLLRHRMDPTSPIDERVRQRALLLPYAIALVTFIGWAMAGIVWGILFRSWPGPSRWKSTSLALRHLGDRRRARHRLRLPGHRASGGGGRCPATSRPAT
jgi:hypothetical protein